MVCRERYPVRKSVSVAILLIMVLISGCTERDLSDIPDSVSIDPEAGTLTIRLIGNQPGSKTDNVLTRKIEAFQSSHPEVKINIQWTQYYGPRDIPTWMNVREPAELYEDDSKEPADLYELVPYQMQELFRLGKIETLNMNEGIYRDYVLTSEDGAVLGVKTKINPLILYYNADIFHTVGLELPDGSWDLQRLNDAIAALKAFGYDVYVPLSPYTLEWAADLHGWKITGVDGTYRGYIDSEATAMAAEWLAGIHEMIDGYGAKPPMPYHLIENRWALAIDYAFDFYPGGANNYETIAQRNPNIGIAALPGQGGSANPAKISGLAIASKSPNKSLAMDLLRYLVGDGDSYYTDIHLLMLSMYGYDMKEYVNEERFSTVTEEMKRAVPASLYMHEKPTHVSYSYILTRLPEPLKAIREGQPAKEQLERYAMEMESQSATSIR